MCRLSLIEYLHDVTGFSKEELIPFVMAPTDEKSLSNLGNDKLQRLWSALESVRVVDPAVGSGSSPAALRSFLRSWATSCEPSGVSNCSF